MVDVVGKRCIVCNITIPSFNYSHIKQPMYCVECKLDDMVNVKSRICEVYNCRKIANYGIPFHYPTKCFLHKSSGMISNPTKRCKHSSCKEYATYGLKYKQPELCEEHQESTHVCLIEQKCTKCGTVDILLDGLCVNICSMLERAYELRIYSKRKERRILSFLKAKYKEPLEYNIKVSSDCGGKHSEVKEIGYDYGTHRVYIEVDENQHRSYCELGEINRMKNIYFNEGGIPIVFIRYNPDGFRNRDPTIKTITSQSMTERQRENHLLTWIMKYKDINSIPYNLSVHYVFYNDHDIIGGTLFEIDPYKDHNNNEKQCSRCEKTFYLDEMREIHERSHMVHPIQ